MRTKVPTLNVINFAAVFVVLYFFNVITSITQVLIATGVGLVLGILIEISYEQAHKRDKPKPLTLSLIGIILVLTVSLVLSTSVIPINLSGHLSGPTTTIQEEVTEEIVEETTYAGVCEQELVEKIYDEIANDYYHDWIWDELRYDCNTKEDCINQLTEKDKDFDEQHIRCTI
jgi:hypothetical protein